MSGWPGTLFANKYAWKWTTKLLSLMWLKTLACRLPWFRELMVTFVSWRISLMGFAWLLFFVFLAFVGMCHAFLGAIQDLKLKCNQFNMSFYCIIWLQVSCTTDDSHMWLAPFMKAHFWFQELFTRERERERVQLFATDIQNGCLVHVVFCTKKAKLKATAGNSSCDGAEEARHCFHVFLAYCYWQVFQAFLGGPLN